MSWLLFTNRQMKQTEGLFFINVAFTCILRCGAALVRTGSLNTLSAVDLAEIYA